MRKMTARTASTIPHSYILQKTFISFCFWGGGQNLEGKKHIIFPPHHQWQRDHGQKGVFLVAYQTLITSRSVSFLFSYVSFSEKTLLYTHILLFPNFGPNFVSEVHVCVQRFCFGDTAGDTIGDSFRTTSSPTSGHCGPNFGPNFGDNLQ